MRVSSTGFPSSLSVAPLVRWQQVGKPCSWRFLSLSLLHPSIFPGFPFVRLHTSMFKLPLSAIQAAVGWDCDSVDARGYRVGFCCVGVCFRRWRKCYEPFNNKLICCCCTYATAEGINAASGYVMLVWFIGKENGDLLFWWLMMSHLVRIDRAHSNQTTMGCAGRNIERELYYLTSTGSGGPIRMSKQQNNRRRVAASPEYQLHVFCQMLRLALLVRWKPLVTRVCRREAALETQCKRGRKQSTLRSLWPHGSRTLSVHVAHDQSYLTLWWDSQSVMSPQRTASSAHAQSWQGFDITVRLRVTKTDNRLLPQRKRKRRKETVSYWG